MNRNPQAALIHPNIVLSDGRRGMRVDPAAESVSGHSLQALMSCADSRDKLNPSVRRLVIAAVADALAYAHEHHVVHGDLRCDNVFITEREEVKVTGFSLTPQEPGAPEPADDVHALACLAYRMFTGASAFDGPGHTPRSPPPYRHGLSPAEYAAIANALSGDTATRTLTIQRFMDELLLPATGPSA